MKTKFIWLVCAVAVLSVSMFLFLDSATFSSAKADDVPSIEVEIPTPPQTNPDQAPDTDKDDGETPEEITIKYTNGYTCIADAYERFENSKYYVMDETSYGGGQIFGIGAMQDVTVSIKKSGSKIKYEGLGYSDSSYGQKFYRSYSTNDSLVFKYIRTPNVNADKTYSLDGVSEQTLALAEIKKVMGENFLNPMYMQCKQGRDKITSFKRDNSYYYVIDVSFNVAYMPTAKIEEIKKESGASACSYNSFVVQYYVNKQTGKIDKMIAKESYNITTMGVSVPVNYTTKTNFTYKSANFAF